MSPFTIARGVFNTHCPGYSEKYTADVVDAMIHGIEKAILDERERCAKLCEEYLVNKFMPENYVPLFHRGEEVAAKAIAQKIRES